MWGGGCGCGKVGVVVGRWVWLWRGGCGCGEVGVGGEVGLGGEVGVVMDR